MYLVYDGVMDRIRRIYFKKVAMLLSRKGKTRILDYGCGPGDMLLECQRQGMDAYGIDSSARSVAIARARGGENVIKADLYSLPYGQGSFDVIFIQSVLEHMERPVESILELKKYLKKGGWLFLSAPTPCSNFWDDPTHIRPYTPKSFQIIGELCELDILQINYVFSFLLGRKASSRIYYKILNCLPFPLGSNLIGIYRKR